MSSEADNIRIWDGERRGHYEIWYVTFNHRASQTGYWIRYTLESPLDGHGEPYAQLWFARFDARDPSRTFGINRKSPIDTMMTTPAPFSVSIGDNRLTHSGARGSIEGDGHSASWDLQWEPAPRTHLHLPRLMYRRGGLGDTTALAPNLDIALRGTVVVDGETYELAGAPGGQTHLWGRKHAHSHAWGHCNAFEGRPGAAFEILTVKLKRRGYVLPAMTIPCLYLDGETHRFTAFHNVPFASGHYGTCFYRFAARGSRIRIEGEYSCRPQDMVVAEYHDPDGERLWCSNTEVGDLRITVFERSGRFAAWRERDRLLAPKTGHFEVTSRQRDSAIDKDHVLVE